MRIEIYRDKKKEWRLRVVATNGRILVISSRGYKRKPAVLNIIARCLVFHPIRYVLNWEKRTGRSSRRLETQ